VEALSKSLNATSIAYGLVRLTEKIDESNTTKFVRITWVGESVPATRKALVTTHKVAIHLTLLPTYYCNHTWRDESVHLKCVVLPFEG